MADTLDTAFVANRSVAFSNGDKTASSSQPVTLRSTIARNPADGGKFYAEFAVDDATSGPIAGAGIGLGSLANIGQMTPQHYAGLFYDAVRDTNGDQRGYYFGGVGAGEVLRVAVDFDRGLFFIRKGVSGYGYNAYGDDPVLPNMDNAGDGAFMAWTDPVYVVCNIDSAGRIIHYRSEASEFTYAIPDGYQAWGTALVDPDPEPTIRARRSVYWF